MGTQPFDNLYHHRRVAEKNAKPCTICYKATAIVLTTPKGEDFFYICTSHLKDRTFAEPHPDEVKALEERKKERELAEVRAQVIKEHADKTKRKDAKDEKTKDTVKDDAVLPKDDGIADLKKTLPEHPTTQAASADMEPRVFKLNARIFSIRVNRIRSKLLAQRTAQVQRQIHEFPSVPGDLP